MPPRTRSNRAEKLAIKEMLTSGVPINTRGLLALPNELYLEILRHLPALPIPHDVWVGEKPDPYRQLTLYHLSQTCQSLRKFFLRYAWERIEVFGGMWTPKGRLATNLERHKRGMDMKDVGDKRLVEEILRQLETVVVRNPDLRQYVSTVNLTILEYSINSVLPEIAQNLTLFPNLHTLQLIFRIPAYRRLQSNFSLFRYPNVHTLNLSRTSPYADILRACPNTKHFSFYKDLGESLRLHQFLAPEYAGRIERLGVLMGLRYHLNVVTALPCLGDISLDFQAANLDCLSSLPLHTIRLRLDEWSHEYSARHIAATPYQRRRWIDWATGILAKCPQHEEGKKVMVVDYNKSVEVFSV